MLILSIVTAINVILTLLVGVMAFFNRKYIIEKERQSKGVVNMKSLKKEEQDEVDKINRKFAANFQNNVDFMDSF